MTRNDYHGFRWPEATCERHFKLLPRSIVAKDGPDGLKPSSWAYLDRSAQSVLVVLLRHADKRGMAYPGEGRLAAMSGLTRKTARKGAKDLEKHGLIRISTHTSLQGRRCKKYHFKTIPSEEGILMPSIFIDNGFWSRLKPASRSLVVAFRLFSKLRPDLDPDYGEWCNSEELSEYMEKREFDFCNAEPCVLREFAGICPRVYSDALRDLEEHHFIEPDPVHGDYWRVNVYTTWYTKPAYLNAKLDGEDW